jgi:F-type H+-transporting ATPase subunit epsilon
MAQEKNDQLHVELVAADRTVWSGEVTMVIARTMEGDIGVLRNHTPVLSALSAGVLTLDPDDGEQIGAAVCQGFITVAHNRVSILSEFTQLAGEVDVSEARSDLEAAESDESAGAPDRVAWAQARIRAAEHVS